MLAIIISILVTRASGVKGSPWYITSDLVWFGIVSYYHMFENVSFSKWLKAKSPQKEMDNLTKI